MLIRVEKVTKPLKICRNVHNVFAFPAAGEAHHHKGPKSVAAAEAAASALNSKSLPNIPTAIGRFAGKDKMGRRYE